MGLERQPKKAFARMRVLEENEAREKAQQAASGVHVSEATPEVTALISVLQEKQRQVEKAENALEVALSALQEATMTISSATQHLARVMQDPNMLALFQWLAQKRAEREAQAKSEVKQGDTGPEERKEGA